MKKKFYSLDVEEREADLVIFGDITSVPWFESDVSAFNLQQEISTLDVDRINVHINSYGGEVAEALAITNTLIRHPAQVVTYVDGFACSAATVIFMAGTRRIMSAYSNFMVHPVWTQTAGNAAYLRQQADDLDRITDQVIKAYMTGVAKSREELEELMAEERFMTPEEVLDWGFATEIEEAEDEERPAASVRELVYDKMRQGSAESIVALRPETMDEIARRVTDDVMDWLAQQLDEPTEPEPDDGKNKPNGDEPNDNPEETAMSRFFNAFT